MAKKGKSNKVRVSLYVPPERMDLIRDAMKRRKLTKKAPFFIEAAFDKAEEIIRSDERHRASIAR